MNGFIGMNMLIVVHDQRRIDRIGRNRPYSRPIDQRKATINVTLIDTPSLPRDSVRFEEIGSQPIDLPLQYRHYHFAVIGDVRRD